MTISRRGAQDQKEPCAGSFLADLRNVCQDRRISVARWTIYAGVDYESSGRYAEISDQQPRLGTERSR